ncbi:hypothetical protein [Paenibacillus sp. FSL E2-0201]|uniref:hypothetical protein n=1 Tax=Paenibacillus sp. FSL E2-0201 TaxID=2954726 RepID=UPI0030DD4AA2
MTSLITVPRLDNLGDTLLYFAAGDQHIPILLLEDLKKGKQSSTRKGNVYLGCINLSIPILIDEVENEKLGICLYLNGSSKDEQVLGIRWHFVDMDEGAKQEQWSRIQKAKLQPTMIYEGRAGYKLLYKIKEAYWDISTPDTIAKSISHFKNVQQQLVEFFGADGSVINPSNALRSPFASNYKEYPERVVTETIVFFDPQNEYSQTEIIEAFPPVHKKHFVRKPISSRYSETELEQIISMFISNLEMEGKEFVDYGDRLAFQCPVHGDNKPSAYMYKENLLVHCSSGSAGGGCEIENGKPLKWVAEKLKWEDLIDVLNDMESVKEQKYLDLQLTDFIRPQVVPLVEDFGAQRDIVIGVMELMSAQMERRNIIFDPTTRQVIQSMTYYTAVNNVNPICIPLPPGGGKSTWLQTYLKYLLKYDLFNAGAVIVVERIETAKQIVEELGLYEVLWNLDAPYWNERPAAYVMESAFSSEYCVKEPKEYTYGICRGCDERFACETFKKYDEQKKYPIVILSHSRLEMEGERLDTYATWYDINRIEHPRRLLIIDEKPPLVTITPLTLEDILHVEGQIRNMQEHLNQFDGVISILEKVKDLFHQDEDDIKCILSMERDFSFDCHPIWNRHYHGTNPQLLKKVELLIRDGGNWSRQPDGSNTITVSSINSLQFDDYNVIILDGTAATDVDYQVMRDRIDILDIPKGYRTYSNATFHVAELSTTKTKLRKNNEILTELATHIKLISSENKVLVLCYKEFKELLSELLSDEVRAGQVLINHFGNVKGSNEYQFCTAVVLVNILNKGEPYYASKFGLLNGKSPSGIINPIRGVRRNHNLEEEKIKLSDQLVSVIQDASRIALRIKDFNASVHVYICTKDRVLTKLVNEYFQGSTFEKWNTGIGRPFWYEAVSQVLSALYPCETITKSEICELLGLTTSSGKRQFRRIQEKPEFKELLRYHDIVELNTRKYVKEITLVE